MVAPASGCELIGIGASTGVGGTARVSLAAFRAGITRTQRIEHGGTAQAWSHAVRVATLTADAAEERARALLSSALAQVAPLLKRVGPGVRVAAWCVGEPWLAEVVARTLGLDPARVAYVAAHACAGLYALREARAALMEERLDVAVLVGVAVESHATALEQGSEQRRIVGGESSFGTVPGEAAAALVWASERFRQQLGVPSLARLLGVGSADEATPFGGPVPCVGTALVEAVRAALGSLPADERVAHVLCNLNGERERTDEWGFALPRLRPRLAEPGAFITPIGAFGDVPAPGGLLLVALASAVCARDDAAARCLIWTSSSGSPRAAALLEVPPGAVAPVLASTPASQPDAAARALALELAAPAAPPWALELDISVLDELVDEAAFRFDQRLYALEQAASGAPDAARPVLTRIEACLEHVVRGLVECGTRAGQRVEAALQAPSAGVLYTAVRVLLGTEGPERAVPVLLAHGGAKPASSRAASLALQHAQPNAAALRPIVGACLEQGPVLAAVAVDIAARGGMRISAARLQAVSDAVADDDVETAAAWLDAMAELDDSEARRCIRRWQFSQHARLRRGWAHAELCLGGADGKAAVVARASQDPAVILPAALAVGSAQVGTLRELASALSGADACLALGLVGDPLAVPILIERLREQELADVAALALELLLGAAPASTRLEPDADPSAPPRPVPCISREPAAWRALADGVLARHPASARLRAGSAASVESTLNLLQRLHLPRRVRRYLARELRVRWFVRSGPHVDALLSQQQRAASSIQPAAFAPRAGAWD